MEKFIGIGKIENSFVAARSKKKEEESLRAMAIWIAGSFIPVSAVQDPGLQLVVNTYDKQAKVPN